MKHGVILTINRKTSQLDSSVCDPLDKFCTTQVGMWSVVTWLRRVTNLLLTEVDMKIQYTVILSVVHITNIGLTSHLHAGNLVATTNSVSVYLLPEPQNFPWFVFVHFWQGVENHNSPNADFSDQQHACSVDLALMPSCLHWVSRRNTLASWSWRMQSTPVPQELFSMRHH